MNEDADETDSYVITHSQDTSPLDRCARIDTEIVEYQLEFDRLSFGAERKEDEPSEGGNGGDGSPPFQPYRASPLAQVAQNPVGYDTLTVEILHGATGQRKCPSVQDDCQRPDCCNRRHFIERRGCSTEHGSLRSGECAGWKTRRPGADHHS